jgi:hypothetical protein
LAERAHGKGEVAGSNPAFGPSFMAHPHPDRQHVMIAYRHCILGEKRRIAGLTHSGRNFRRGARGLIHYLDYVQEYLAAKRDVLRARSSAW